MSADAATPPSPLWSDELTGLSVWLNGPFIEITMHGFDGGWSGRLTADQAAQVDAAGFATALATAQEWAQRWDIDARAYRSVSPISGTRELVHPGR
ncbi:hypothetical protein SEA_DIRTYBOI_41 [Gordonia phage DirtyBoi]|nr:hypothetical protein SEA_DIRTYBOI_41 [Gordonia phage DirtyBoi]